jgi:hypothetical protein
MCLSFRSPLAPFPLRNTERAVPHQPLEFQGGTPRGETWGSITDTCDLSS